MKDVENRTILVIDDDEGIRDLFAAVLRRAGFGVVLAANGAEGVEQIELVDFDAVTCDLQMPVVGGAECYAKVVTIRPDVAERFIFVASEPDLAGQHFLRSTGCPVLWKPASPRDLVNTVRTVVDRLAHQCD